MTELAQCPSLRFLSDLNLCLSYVGPHVCKLVVKRWLTHRCVIKWWHKLYCFEVTFNRGYQLSLVSSSPPLLQTTIMKTWGISGAARKWQQWLMEVGEVMWNRELLQAEWVICQHFPAYVSLCVFVCVCVYLCLYIFVESMRSRIKSQDWIHSLALN